MSEYYDRAERAYFKFNVKRGFDTRIFKDDELKAFVDAIRPLTDQITRAEVELETLRRRYRWLERARTWISSIKLKDKK